jgi:Lrp/AsnC family transcriptional regulator
MCGYAQTDFVSGRQAEESSLDFIDRKILACLQEDASTPVAAVAERAGISVSPCWRRIQKLTEDGVIRRRVALLDPEKINVAVNVFVSVRTSKHTRAWSDDFCREVQKFPEIVEFYRMSGDVDYLIRVVVPSIAAYDAFYKRLIEVADLQDVSSSFSMETIKYTTELPLDYLK